MITGKNIYTFSDGFIASATNFTEYDSDVRLFTISDIAFPPVTEL